MTIVENWTEIKTIGLKLDHNSLDHIIVIYENIKSQSATRYFPGSSNITCNAFIKKLSAKVVVNSLQEVPLPVFELTDTQQSRTLKSLDVEWGTDQRYELEVYTSPNNRDWFEEGTISILNPRGYPYRKYNLLDVVGTDLAIELGDNGRIGVAVRNVGQGLLKPGDLITITGSVTEEATIINSLVELPENVQLGNMAFQPSNSVGITGGNVEGVRLRELTEPLAVGSGGTGVDNLSDLKTLVKSPPLLSEIAGLETLTPGKLLRLNSAGTAIISVSTPIWSNLTLQNSWTNVTGFTTKYRQWASGLVEIRGVITRASAPTANSTIFSIPTELAPDTPIGSYQQALNNNSILALSLGVTGNIIFLSGTTTSQNAFAFCYMAG